jgi:NAD(P)-dependent dehydrogenase (short-subunit alcohol dehydrogenase family)
MSDMSASALVVIGAGGMGLAVARRLAGGRRLLLADNSEASLETAVTALRGEGHLADGHAVDVSDRASVDKLASAVASAGRVDAVIHTAGVSPVTATARQIYQVDLLGTAHVIDAFLATSWSTAGPSPRSAGTPPPRSEAQQDYRRP